MVVLILVGSGAASTAASALVTVLLIVAGVIVLAITGGVGWLVYRARRALKSPGAWVISGPPAHQLPPEVRPHLEAPRQLAIEPPREIHIHIHTADPAEAAAIIRTALPGTSRDAITERNE